MSQQERAKVLQCLVLASGQSSRFGSRKLLHRFASGRTILQTVLDQYVDVINDLSVVVASDDPELKESLSHYQVRFISNNNAHLGLSSSIVAGVNCLDANAFVLIALGDMPRIQQATIEAIKHAIEGADEQTIVIPRHCGRVGHPVGFGASFRGELLSLTGDTGAKAVVQANLSSVVYVDVDDSGILFDIDSPNDLKGCEHL